MQEDFTKKKRWMNIGSVVSAAGLVLYFLGRALGFPEALLGAVAVIATGLSVATLFLMIACRQDGGKEIISGNRLVGQGALVVLLAMAAAVVLKGAGLLA
ncbi:hypothetical protein [Oscillibacter sp.]|uniref:hypothetical protein n=1 Tax=Oscillibacter sp. TaxID=1945593 RepID=UPI0028AF7DEF|nr:hypothetical protein [Oscillibacter sp.]